MDIDVYSVRVYNRGLSSEEIEVNSEADKKRFNNTEIIPLYTEQELVGVETGKVYELKNDIDVKGDYTSIINKINNKEIEIKSNDKKITNNGKYYMSNSKYTIPVNKYGYVIDGLELLLDGIDNAGTGTHNNGSAIWKDLSGKGRDGTLKNIDVSNAWENEGLKFDGIDDIVAIGELNYENITLEVIAKPEEKLSNSTYMSIIGNTENGGYHIMIGDTKKFNFGVYLKETASYLYNNLTYQSAISSNRKYLISGTYDNKKIKLLTSDFYTELEQSGTIGTTMSNTYMVLGGNPLGSEYKEAAYHGTIYSARVYSKALSDEEKSTNYMNDMVRYKMNV